MTRQYPQHDIGLLPIGTHTQTDTHPLYTLILYPTPTFRTIVVVAPFDRTLVPTPLVSTPITTTTSASSSSSMPYIRPFPQTATGSERKRAIHSFIIFSLAPTHTTIHPSIHPYKQAKKQQLQRYMHTRSLQRQRKPNKNVHTSRGAHDAFTNLTTTMPDADHRVRKVKVITSYDFL